MRGTVWPAQGGLTCGACAPPAGRPTPRRAPPQVDDLIAKFAKKGLTPSQIGVLLRDSHGVAQIKSVTGSKVLRILKKQGE
jgi:small subunit ribosomal protein S13e